MSSRRRFLRAIVAAVLASLGLLLGLPLSYRRLRTRYEALPPQIEGQIIHLPMPRLSGVVSLEETLANRRSIREYTDEPLTIEELAQLLWAAQGISETRHGFRTAPSAGATYPLEVYAVIAPRGVLAGGMFLEPGSYKYLPHSHTLVQVRRGDLVEELYRAALEQEWVREAPVNLVFTAVYERTTRRYGARGVRYVHIEVGHAGQNVYLQAVALGLATVAIGAFHDEAVREIIGAPEEEKPLYIMPVARPAWRYRLDPRGLAEYIERRRS